MTARGLAWPFLKASNTDKLRSCRINCKRKERSIFLNAGIGARGKTIIARLSQELAMLEIPFGSLHWREAVEAYERYGRGRHPARLNFGDCLSHATAKLAGQPLLNVGNGFSKTDIEKA